MTEDGTPGPGASLEACEEAMIRAWESGDGDALAGLFLEDATMLLTNRPPVTGRRSIRSLLAETLSLPGVKVRCQPRVRRGDDRLAFSIVDYETTFEADRGALSHEGSYLAMWEQSAEGWRICAYSATANQEPGEGPP